MTDLKKRTALFTGAGGGIGFGITSVLVAAAARVVTNDVDTAAAARAVAERGERGDGDRRSSWAEVVDLISGIVSDQGGESGRSLRAAHRQLRAAQVKICGQVRWHYPALARA